MAAVQGAISKRRKFVADGVFYAELNEFFQRELAEEGYSGVEVRVTPTVTDIIIRATHTQEVLGEQGRRIRELTSLIQKRFKFPENSVSLYAAKVQNRGLSAVAQCESLRYKLLNGLAVRRACYGVLRFIMESGAKGCEVVVSGKLRAARAKSMKFTSKSCAAAIPKGSRVPRNPFQIPSPSSSPRRNSLSYNRSARTMAPRLLRLSSWPSSSDWPHNKRRRLRARLLVVRKVQWRGLRSDFLLVNDEWSSVF
ncbi:40S ribosomal protein S3 [Histoplasma capsulatum]|uniref:40S ribosomal protein S3 n=1 Tax=Ajellomyces capsulatus TaxID=5037 RepID=A0A8A1MFD8_AJECA|nr:40S ribosomal protein S3 [Histoplasma capsulatum]